MKKGLLLFLLILPMATAIECLTYEDCGKLSCPGGTRSCYEGLCTYSDCMNTDIPSEDDVTTIIQMSSRFVFIALLIVAIALLFPILKLHDKAKALAIIGFIFMALVFFLYLINGPGILDIFRNNDDFNSDTADQLLIDFLNSEEVDVDERLLYSQEFSGKEYKIQGQLARVESGNGPVA